MFDYVIALREGIMDAWGGIIGAMKASGKSTYTNTPYWWFFFFNADVIFTAGVLEAFVSSIFDLLNTIASDANRSEALMRSAMGVIG